MDGRGMGAHGGGGGGASGAQRAQRTLDFGACARAVSLDARGSIRWRRCGRARSYRLILSLVLRLPRQTRRRWKNAHELRRLAPGGARRQRCHLPVVGRAGGSGPKAALAKEAQAAAEKLSDLQIERAALQKQQAEFEAWSAAEREKIREAHRRIDASRAEFNVEHPQCTKRRSRLCAPTANSSSGHGAPLNRSSPSWSARTGRSPKRRRTKEN
jgi:hypothetical protein